MNTIVVGTTPTIQFKFNTIALSSLSQARLTIKRGSEIVLTKTLYDAVVEDDSLSWTLSQAETLSVGKGIRTAMLNWLTADGTRGVSPEVHVMFSDNHIRQVM